MTFIEPDKKSLQAACGWALTKKANASDEQVLALDAYGRGCEELATVIDDLTRVQRPVEKRPLAPAHLTESHPTVQDVAIETRPMGVCKHLFDITTQKCKRCGKTYRAAMASRPEYLGDPRYAPDP